jgi:hypothetical protein
VLLSFVGEFIVSPVEKPYLKDQGFFLMHRLKMDKEWMAGK